MHMTTEQLLRLAERTGGGLSKLCWAVRLIKQHSHVDVLYHCLVRGMKPRNRSLFMNGYPTDIFMFREI